MVRTRTGLVTGPKQQIKGETGLKRKAVALGGATVPVSPSPGGSQKRKKGKKNNKNSQNKTGPRRPHCRIQVKAKQLRALLHNAANKWLRENDHPCNVDTFVYDISVLRAVRMVDVTIETFKKANRMYRLHHTDQEYLQAMLTGNLHQGKHCTDSDKYRFTRLIIDWYRKNKSGGNNEDNEVKISTKSKSHEGSAKKEHDDVKVCSNHVPIVASVCISSYFITIMLLLQSLMLPCAYHIPT